MIIKRKYESCRRSESRIYENPRYSFQLRRAFRSSVILGDKMTKPSAIVVGGGLSGMVIARELALRGWRVILLERSKRLGGKAGSDLRNGRRVEHGYHVFPQWYPNVRGIVERIGVKLIDFDRY